MLFIELRRRTSFQLFRIPFYLSGGAIQIGADEVKAGVDGREMQALRKRAGVPEIDPDAFPSTYCSKMLQRMSKRSGKATEIKDLFAKIKKPNDTHTRSIVNLRKCAAVVCFY